MLHEVETVLSMGAGLAEIHRQSTGFRKVVPVANPIR